MVKQNQPRLLVSKEYAETKIERQLEIGRWLRTDRTIQSEEELDEVRLEANKWSKYNEDLLVKLVDQGPAIGYTRYQFGQRSDKEIRSIIDNSLIRIHDWFEYETDEFRSDMMISISSLEGIYDRLELYEELPDRTQYDIGNKNVVKASPISFGNEVFIVHGRDDGAKDAVALFIRDLGFNEIILDRKPNSGLTIIEKFEDHASNAEFAIALLTPDDVGALKEEADNELKSRARQNVILELGYFMGRLGRSKVCLLIKGKLENPSDLDGLLYVEMGDTEVWRMKVAKEMIQAGLPVDMNKLA